MLSTTGASWDCWEDVTISGCSEDTISGCSEDTISGCSEDTISGCSEDTISGCSDDTISGCEGASEIAEIAETMLSTTGPSWDCWEDVTISGCSDDTISGCAEDTISGCSEDTIFGCKGASENMLSNLWRLVAVGKMKLKLKWSQFVAVKGPGQS